MVRYRLRALLIVLALGPPVLAGLIAIAAALRSPTPPIIPPNVIRRGITGPHVLDDGSWAPSYPDTDGKY